MVDGLVGSVLEVGELNSYYLFNGTYCSFSSAVTLPVVPWPMLDRCARSPQLSNSIEEVHETAVAVASQYQLHPSQA